MALERYFGAEYLEVETLELKDRIDLTNHAVSTDTD